MLLVPSIPRVSNDMPSANIILPHQRMVVPNGVNFPGWILKIYSAKKENNSPVNILGGWYPLYRGLAEFENIGMPISKHSTNGNQCPNFSSRPPYIGDLGENRYFIMTSGGIEALLRQAMVVLMFQGKSSNI